MEKISENGLMAIRAHCGEYRGLMKATMYEMKEDFKQRVKDSEDAVKQTIKDCMNGNEELDKKFSDQKEYLICLDKKLIELRTSTEYIKYHIENNCALHHKKIISGD
jgi:hypothetical protein